MYRIELAPGEVTVFRSIEELATGVRNGVITSKARIYHGASEKWLPIEFHPHYKQALELSSAKPGDPHAPKAERPRSDGLVFMNVPISPLTVMPVAAAPTPAPAPPPPAPPIPTPVVEAPVAQAPVAQAAPVERPAFVEDEHEADGSSVDQPPIAERRVHQSQGHQSQSQPPQGQPPQGYDPQVHESWVHESWSQESWGPEPRVPEPPVTAPRLPERHFDAQESHRSPVHGSAADESPVHESPAHVSAVRVPPAKAPVLDERLVEAPRVRPTLEELFAPPGAHRAPELPPVSASPVLELPKISYPEFTLAEAPAAEPSSSAARARRPLHLVGAVILLAAGGYASTLVFPFGRTDGGFTAASTMADRPIVPVRTSSQPIASPPVTPTAKPRPATAALPPATSPVPAPVATDAPSSASATRSADNTPLPPASSGFAPALEPRAIVAPPKPPAQPVAADSSAIAPPAIDMDVATPTLQSADSLAAPPRQQGDSALKKILRALNGGKTLP